MNWLTDYLFGKTINRNPSDCSGGTKGKPAIELSEDQVCSTGWISIAVQKHTSSYNVLKLARSFHTKNQASVLVGVPC